MKKNSTTISLKTLLSILSRFNLVIFIVLVAGGLIASILILNKILTQPYANNTVPSTPIGITLDQSTIDRLSKLETSANNINYKNLPSSRINPFSE